MIETEQYVKTIMHMITAPQADRARIEADLRDHLAAAVQSGESIKDVIERMGSPVEVAAAFMAQVPLTYASFWPRVGAFIVDMIIVVPVVSLMVGVVALAGNAIPQTPQGIEYVYAALLGLVLFGMVLAMIGTGILYFPILEARFGRTPGKRLFHLRVLKEDGLPIGFKEAFIRRLSFYFEIFVVDALFALFTEKKQRAFDIVARTVVVQEE